MSAIKGNRWIVMSKLILLILSVKNNRKMMHSFQTVRNRLLFPVIILHADVPCLQTALLNDFSGFETS